VRVLAPQGWQELVAETLAFGPCTSVAFGRPSLASDPAPEGQEYVRTFFSSHEDSPELRASITRALAELATRAEAPELIGLAPQFRALPPEDYANSWKKSWKPFRVGRLSVTAPWTPPKTTRNAPATPIEARQDARAALDVHMLLEPGGAFGSGRHATTRACLRAIQERVRPGQRVLDAGTGSGILAVTAVLFGASEALGFDFDPNAEPYANELARANGVADRAHFVTAGFECLARETRPFDAVFANIYSDVIAEHVGTLRDALVPGGWFVFSGCPVHHALEIKLAIESSGLTLDEIRVRGRWHTFLGRR
jgi:ribosomal protein L11 methyltransferase